MNFIKRISKEVKLVTILIILILFSSFMGSLVHSGFNKVKISTHKFDARDNQVVAYDLYKPKSATEDNKAPLIFVIPGFQRSRETQQHVALELARRGFVVINIDPYSQGDSTSSMGTEGKAIATIEGYGSFDMIDYFYDNPYPYMDIDKIGVTGHSAGGNAAYQAAVHFGKKAVENNGVSKVHSIFISGYVLSINSSINFSKSNMGMDYALYDEGAFRNQENTEVEITNKADMTYAIESHDFVNSGLKANGESSISYNEPIEMGKIYGNPNLRNMRQVFNTKTIHAFQPYSKEANATNIEFFEIAMDFRSDIDAYSQIWQVKEVFTTISLIASLILIVPLATLLYRIPFFASSKTEPIINTNKRSTFGKIRFIVVFIITALFAFFTYLPVSKLTLTLFKDASNSNPTWFFPQRMTNAVMVWAFISGLFGMLVFYLSQYLTHLYKVKVKKEESSMVKHVNEWGVKIPFKNILKTVLVGLIVVVIYFSLLTIVYYTFKVDFRFIFLMAARKLNLKVLIQALMYIPFFFVFYFSNSIRVNGGQMHGNLSEGVKLTLAGFMNIAGLAIILLVQYITFAKTGTIAYTELSDGTTQWLYVNILFTLLPVMFLMPFFNRLFYKISGNSYLGPVIITIIFVIMSLNNSVAYIPL